MHCIVDTRTHLFLPIVLYRTAVLRAGSASMSVSGGREEGAPPLPRALVRVENFEGSAS